MWDPTAYLSFQDERTRPARELLSRVPVVQPRRVVDAGCGAGTVTPLLRGRWPEALVEAFDSAAEMVDEARAQGVHAHVRDVRGWRPGADMDVVFCNAVLHWVPEHLGLLRSWRDLLPSGACLAWQVPGNFTAPSHTLVRELAAERKWYEQLRDAVPAPDASCAAVDYAAELAGEHVEVDAWETTYVHALHGSDPVLEWLAGAGLRSVRAALTETEWWQFRADLAPRLREAYPPRSDGVTWFPFRRVFAVLNRL